MLRKVLRASGPKGGRPKKTGTACTSFEDELRRLNFAKPRAIEAQRIGAAVCGRPHALGFSSAVLAFSLPLSCR
jgi:hypothetical protein